MEPEQYTKKHHYLAFILFVAIIFIVADTAGHDVSVSREKNVAIPPVAVEAESIIGASILQGAPTVPVVEKAAHISMPAEVRGVYLTGWSAGNRKTVDRIIGMLERANMNTVVIDIKDATGKLSYQPKDPDLLATGVGTKRIADLAGLIERLHERGIYVIGRVSVFQDPFYANLHPEDAFLDTRTGGIWRDYKGISWLRPDRTAVWDYVTRISRDAYTQGFDEINVDYVRFPSDGELSFLDRSFMTMSRAQVIENFFKHLDLELRERGIPLSADLFGLTLTAHDDLGIGQKLELIAPYVDAVCPMIYPSHFSSGFSGLLSPAEHPYEVIYRSLQEGVKKIEAINLPKEMIRPWLQDFNLGAIYTADMVRAQIVAASELGIPSWLMWDPKNLYTEPAFSFDQ